MTALVLTNARLVLPDEVVHGTLAVADGRIAGIDAGRSSLPGAVDCGGDHVLPGLVELHTDHLERHYRPRPGVTWPAKVAVVAHDAQLAASGITTVLDALYAGGREDTVGRMEGIGDMVEALRWGMAQGVLRAEHHLHLRCELGQAGLLDLVEPFGDDPIVRLVSLMDHTPGQRQFTDVAKYRIYYQGKFGFTNDEMDRFMVAQSEAIATHGVRNRDRLVALCRARGIPLASHDDATPEHVAEAVDAGAVIAEFPTTLDAARAAHAAGLGVMMGGPNVVLGGSHGGNVSAQALAEAGCLDILSSDYVPSSLLHGAFHLAEAGIGLDLPAAVAMVTAKPAALVGMTDRGRLTEGLRADLVQVSPGLGAESPAPIVRQVWRAGAMVA